jgi:hypothetical protein
VRRLLVVLALTVTGCAHVQPIVKYTCMGCTALLASGVCQIVGTSEKVVPPECKVGEVAVVLNWEAMAEKGAAPILGCKKEKK